MPKARAKLAPENGAARHGAVRRTALLTQQTQIIFNRFEAEIGIPLLAYWTSSGGSICQNDVMAMSQLLDTCKPSPVVGLFLKSDGGNPGRPCASYTCCAAGSSAWFCMRPSNVLPPPPWWRSARMRSIWDPPPT